MSGEQAFRFPFHYGQEAESYTFYRVPKILFTAEAFDHLSTDSKLLYGILLDRMQLSVRNRWIDDDGKVILGDSLHKSKSYWGSDGLLKTGKLTVKDMLSFIKRDDGWTVNKEKPGKGRIFYKDSADRGYLLIRKDSAE